MTEPIIHDSAPAGSPILAYGTLSGEKHDRPRLFLLLAGGGILIVVAFIALATSLLLARVPVPKDTAVLAYIRTSTPLPEQTPAVWNKAQTEHSILPIFIGLANSEKGPVYFAITPRPSRLWGSAPRGFWEIESDEPLDIEDSPRPATLASSLSDYTAPAWLKIWLSSDKSISGPINNGSWRTDAKLPATKSDAATIGPNHLDLSHLPAGWPLIQGMLQAQGLNFNLPIPPARMSWAITDAQHPPSIGLYFDEPLATSTQIALLAGAGFFDKRIAILSDGSLSTELLPPSAFLANTTNTRWKLRSGREAELMPQAFLLGDLGALSASTTIPQSCAGQLVATLDRPSLAALGHSLPLLSIFSLSDLAWTEQDGRAVACW